MPRISQTAKLRLESVYLAIDGGCLRQSLISRALFHVAGPGQLWDTTVSTTNDVSSVDFAGTCASIKIEAWVGEVRTNLIRLAALTAFYIYHLLNVFAFSDDPNLPGRFHLTVSLVVFVWATGAVLLHFVLSRRAMYPVLPFIVIVWDIVLVTALLCVCERPQSTLVSVYFLIIASASLRYSLPPVYLSSFGSLIGYLVFLGYARFVLQASTEQRIPRTNQVIFGMALLAAGLLAAQSVR